MPREWKKRGRQSKPKCLRKLYLLILFYPTNLSLFLGDILITTRPWHEMTAVLTIFLRLNDFAEKIIGWQVDFITTICIFIRKNIFLDD